MSLLLTFVVAAAQWPVLDLSCKLEPEKSRMRIAASVTMPPAPLDTDKATFFLSDRMEVPKVRVLAPEELKGDASPKNTFVRDHDVTFQIQLPGTLKKGSTLKLEIEYANKDTKGFVYMLSPKTCFAGGYNTCWFPSVGSSRRVIGEMRFESPSGYIVKASGKEQPATESNGSRTSSFEILQPTVPTFAAARFKVTKVQGVIPMTVYLLKERPVAQTFADGCSKILAVLTREFGPYPFPDFSIIETPSPESGRELGFAGASFEGFMFADSDSIDSGFNLAYFGHEMGHQWWGNLIQLRGSKGAYMLSEAMAQYGSLQCVTEIDGPVGAVKYRTSGYPGYNPSQSGHGAILYSATPEDRPLSNLPSGNDPVFHQFANSKGFLVWDTIARQMGRERFRRALHGITSRFAWKAVGFDDFLAELKSAGGSSVGPVLSQWLDRPGVPVIWCDWTQGKGDVSIILRQKEPAYQLTLPIVISLADGSAVVKELTLDSTSSIHRIPIRQRVARVRIDPDHQVFHSTPELQKKAEALRFLTLGEFARRRGKTEDAVPIWKKGLLELPHPDAYAVEFRLHAAIANANRYLRLFAEAKREYERAFACAIRDTEVLPHAYLNYARVLRELGDNEAAERSLRNAEAADAALPERTGVVREIEVFRSTPSK